MLKKQVHVHVVDFSCLVWWPHITALSRCAFVHDIFKCFCRGQASSSSTEKGGVEGHRYVCHIYSFMQTSPHALVQPRCWPWISFRDGVCMYDLLLAVYKHLLAGSTRTILQSISESSLKRRGKSLYIVLAEIHVQQKIWKIGALVFFPVLVTE